MEQPCTLTRPLIWVTLAQSLGLGHEEVAAMSGWNAMTYQGRDTMPRVVAQQANGFFEPSSAQQGWGQPAACAKWQVRDVVGHLVDTTQSYLLAFDAARAMRGVDPPYRLPAMQPSVRPAHPSPLFVLTVFGRCNAGTVRGDPVAAQRHLNLFFPI
jgi:Mycothiol maleylpyruvate isomerase N-terminal domain